MPGRLSAKPMPSRFMAHSYDLGFTGSWRRAGARVGFIARVLDDAVNEESPPKGGLYFSLGERSHPMSESYRK
jgi:hypothetical protein